MRNDKNTWKLKKEFPCIIKSIKHEGNELNISVREIPSTTTMDKLTEFLHEHDVKMYCIRTNEQILADERGIKCLKSLKSD